MKRLSITNLSAVIGTVREKCNNESQYWTKRVTKVSTQDKW